MYFFLGPTPEAATQQFTGLIGRHLLGPTADIKYRTAN